MLQRTARDDMQTSSRVDRQDAGEDGGLRERMVGAREARLYIAVGVGHNVGSILLALRHGRHGTSLSGDGKQGKNSATKERTCTQVR